MDNLGAAPFTGDLSASAVEFGFETTWIADFLAKYGPGALAIVVEAMRLGFTKQFILELLTKFGPAVLEFIVNLFNKKLSMGAEQVGDQLDIVIVLLEKYLPMILEKYGPMLWEKYGFQIIQWLIEMVIKAPVPEPIPSPFPPIQTS